MDKKIKAYAWVYNPIEATDNQIRDAVKYFKSQGIDGLMCSAGHDPKIYSRIGKIVKNVDIQFHAWIPTLIQPDNPALRPEWYAVNRLGESSYNKPAYVSWYQFVCPNNDEIFNYLSELYESIAIVEEVDGIHLDYIRFPDVILAPGLRKKYDLIMDKEKVRFDNG